MSDERSAKELAALGEWARGLPTYRPPGARPADEQTSAEAIAAGLAALDAEARQDK